MQIIGLMSKKDLRRIISLTLRRMDLDKAEKAISAGRQAAQEMGVREAVIYVLAEFVR